MERGRDVQATMLGVVAILLWSSLALLTTATRGLPPMEVLALSFALAAGSGLSVLACRGRAALRRLRAPPAAWMLGFAGLLLYHALYFVALAWAPAAEASLIAYLWPLLIVLFAALLPGGRLRAGHVLGAVLGLAGTALLLLGRRTESGGIVPHGQVAIGYVAALGCALVWSGYSVLNRRHAAAPSESLVGICAAVSAAGFALLVASGGMVAPSAGQWAALAGLGVGPVGLAFLAWDHATKHGRLALLGTLAYLAPLLSTLLLIVSGRAAPSVALLGAAVLIIGGAAIAARA